jgi:cytochrome c biogenesis protein CcmG/thiol:disulfide interchange protein DsbE
MAVIGRRTLVGAITGALAAPGVVQAKIDKPAIGQPAPPYSVISFDRKEIKSTSLAGQVVVLNLWATWCGPCQREMAQMDAYVRRHRDPDLKIYAITLDPDGNKELLNTLTKLLSFPLAAKLWGKSYGTLGGVPTSYVIGRDGVLRYAEAAAFTEATFGAVVEPLLAAAKSA